MPSFCLDNKRGVDQKTLLRQGILFGRTFICMVRYRCLFVSHKNKNIYYFINIILCLQL